MWNDASHVKFHKSLFWVPILAAGGPYWVLISQKVGSLFQSMGVLISLADSNVLVWIPSVGQMTKLMDSLSSSDDRIGGCPQQVGCWNCQQVDSLSRSDDTIDGFPQQLWGQNWRMPSAGRMPLGSYLVNFGPFDLIFDPLWGFSVKIAYWNWS